MDLPFGDPARRDRQAPVVLDAITETATGQALTPDAMAARLASVRLLFVGESHTSLAAHQAQARIIEALAATGRPVLVGLEMLPDGDRAPLDGWVSGRLDEEAFVEAVGWYEHWGYDFRYYRDIFVAARDRRVPLYGVNTAREVITAVRKKGFDGLSPEERALLPPRIDTSSAEHRRLFQAMLGGGGGAHGHEMGEEQWDGLFRAQCAWDAVMAWHALRALESEGGPDAIMVVLLGAGHVAFGLGAPRQAALHTPLPVATLIPVPVSDEDGRPAAVRASYADFLWGLPPEPTSAPFPTLGVFTTLRKGEPDPLVVAMIAEGSAAEAAGIRAQDRLLEMDGVPLPDKATFSRLMATKQWGDGVQITVRRGTERLTLTAALRR